jgi:uncharacterized protein
MKQIIKILFIILGTAFLWIGLIGLLIPVFPTTPFLIISGFFFINSSEKLYHRLIDMKYFGIHVKNYVEERSIIKKFKVLSLMFIWIPTSITIIFIVDEPMIRLASILFGLLISIHILSLRSID